MWLKHTYPCHISLDHTSTHAHPTLTHTYHMHQHQHWYGSSFPLFHQTQVQGVLEKKGRFSMIQHQNQGPTQAQ